MCAAWHIWHAASSCPLTWEWLRAWTQNTAKSTARVRANSLSSFGLVLCLPTISILYATPILLLTLELFRSEHPCVTTLGIAAGVVPLGGILLWQTGKIDESNSSRQSTKVLDSGTGSNAYAVFREFE
jgi:hypothetical protein